MYNEEVTDVYVRSQNGCGIRKFNSAGIVMRYGKFRIMSGQDELLGEYSTEAAAIKAMDALQNWLESGNPMVFKFPPDHA